MFLPLLGDEKWPAVCLHFIGGEQFGHRDRVYVEPLDPGAVTGISIEMHSPSVQGIYQGQWRMRSEEKGMYFGGMVCLSNNIDLNSNSPCLSIQYNSLVKSSNNII